MCDTSFPPDFLGCSSMTCLPGREIINVNIWYFTTQIMNFYHFFLFVLFFKSIFKMKLWLYFSLGKELQTLPWRRKEMRQAVGLLLTWNRKVDLSTQNAMCKSSKLDNTSSSQKLLKENWINNIIIIIICTNLNWSDSVTPDACLEF